MSKELSSISNGGLVGPKTIKQDYVDCFVQFNDVVPGTFGFDRDDGPSKFRVRPAVQEGHIMFYQISGFDTCTMYCAVTIDGELVWNPVLISGNIVSKSTGEAL